MRRILIFSRLDFVTGIPLLALLLFCSTLWAQELRSGNNRLAVEASTGRIQALTIGDKNLVLKPAGGPIRLHVPLPDFQAQIIEAYKTKPEIKSVSNGLVITYSRLNGKRGSVDISATVRISSLNDGGFALQATVDNHSDGVIPQVFFPWISGFSRIDGPDDQVTFGKSHFKPWREWAALPGFGRANVHEVSQPSLFRSSLSQPLPDRNEVDGFRGTQQRRFTVFRGYQCAESMARGQR